MANVIYHSPMASRTIFEKADNLLLIVVGVVIALVALKVVGAIFGFAWFLVKVAMVTAVAAGVWRAVAGRRGELGAGRRSRALNR